MLYDMPIILSLLDRFLLKIDECLSMKCGKYTDNEGLIIMTLTHMDFVQLR
jgi:hypothetical protein